MAFTHSIRNPVYGMSTVPAIARSEGFCEFQENWVNDAARGITRRASSKMIGIPQTADITEVLLIETFKVDTAYKTYMLAVDSLSVIAFYEWTTDGIIMLGSGFPDIWQLDHTYRLFYIDDQVYILNTDITVETEELAGYDEAKITANIVIPVAIGYGETLRVKVRYVDAEGTATEIRAWGSYTSTSYNGDNQAVADQSRAKDTVTTAVANLFTTYTSPLGNGTQSFRKYSVAGSIVVAMSEADRDSNDGGFIEVVVESSSLGITAIDSDAITAYNPVIQSTSGLPKYSTPTAWKMVQSDPRVLSGTYYLRPEPVTASTEVDYMHEVAWVETYSFDGTAGFVKDTLPYVWDIETEELSQLMLKNRPAGTETSNKNPYFVDNKINVICGAQERLGIVVNDKVWWSKTDDALQMWRTSAVQVLSTDAFGIGNAGVTTSFRQVAHHNRKLLFIGAEQQAVIDNDTPLVNGTTTLAVSTSSSIDTSVTPMSVGSDVYLGTKVNESAGLLRYYTADTRGTDDTEDVTAHVRGLIKGNIVAVYGNDNSETIAIRSQEASEGVLYVGDINTVDEDKTVHAWSRWHMDGVNIVHAYVSQDAVIVYGSYEVDGQLYYALYEIDIFYNVLDVAGKICLEHRITFTATADGDVATLPVGYPEGDVFVVAIDGDFPLIAETNTRTGNTVMFNSKAGVTYLLGMRYSSTLTLSTLYRYDKAGMPKLHDRLRIKGINVHMAEMYRLNRRILSKWDEFELEDEEMVTESYTNMSELYALKPFEGSYPFSVGMNSTDCNISFICDYELTGVITGLTYVGVLHNSQT